MPYITYKTTLEFFYIIRRSLVLRFNKVIVYLIYISVIKGIKARVRLIILAQSSY
jgi:hypothetical protein